MIRLVLIGNQILDHHKDFAFYDTIVDQFVSINGETVFSSRQDLLSELYRAISRGYAVSVAKLEERLLGLLKGADIFEDTPE